MLNKIIYIIFLLELIFCLNALADEVKVDFAPLTISTFFPRSLDENLNPNKIKIFFKIIDLKKGIKSKLFILSKQKKVIREFVLSVKNYEDGYVLWNGKDNSGKFLSYTENPFTIEIEVDSQNIVKKFISNYELKIVIPWELDYYKGNFLQDKINYSKLSWEEIVVPTKSGKEIYVILKTKGLYKYENLKYKIKLFRQEEYFDKNNNSYKIIELKQTDEINEFVGKIFFTDESYKDKMNNTISITQGDDGVLEVCAADGAGDGGFETEYLINKLKAKGYKSRGNATTFSITDEGTAEEHENEGIPILNNEFIQFAGVEKIIIDAVSDTYDFKPYYISSDEWENPGFSSIKDWLLVKNQADIFYYSLHGEHETSAAICAKTLRSDLKRLKKLISQIVPRRSSFMLSEHYYRTITDEIGANWNFDLEWIYFAGCSVLDFGGEASPQWANFHHKKYNHWYDSRPGLSWARNLLIENKNLHGILGFCGTGKSDCPTIDEAFNYNNSIVQGWMKNTSLLSNMYIAPAMLYRPECAKDTFTNLTDYNPSSNKLMYWYSYIPVTYSFPERKRVSELKLVDINAITPRAPDYLMIENVPCLVQSQIDNARFEFKYYPAFYPERESANVKSLKIKNLTPLLSWGYFKPGYQVKIMDEDDVFIEITPGVINLEKEDIKNFGSNFESIDDKIVNEWNIQIYNYKRELIIDEIFKAELKKTDQPNLLWEASYKVKKKLNPNGIYYFRIKGKNSKNNLWSPFSRLQWFKTM